MIASVLAERGGRWARVAWIWPVVMSVACVLNGAHAVADVAASWVVWPLTAFALRRWSGDRLAAPENEAREQAEDQAGGKRSQTAGEQGFLAEGGDDTVVKRVHGDL